jgi:hypothetical protein
MNSFFEPLVAGLREELAGYGGLLNLFDEQQGHLWQRDALRVVDTAHAIEELAATTAAHRATREAWVRDFAAARGQPADASLRQLLPLFPNDLQLLLDALIREINHLVHRLRRRARQNQTLMARALELQREAVAALRPGSFTRTYAPTGRMSTAADAVGSMRAAG